MSDQGCVVCNGFGPLLKNGPATLSFDGKDGLVLSVDQPNAQKFGPATITHVINYCPFCGRKLGDR